MTHYVSPVSSAASRGIRGEHLYVLQCSFGLIKVGRSGNVKKRLASLETAAGRYIKVVAIVDGGGEREREIHGLLTHARRRGEWFTGTLAVQKQLQEALGMPLSFPYGDQGTLRRGVAAKQAAQGRADLEAAVQRAVKRIGQKAARKKAITAALARKR